MGGRLKGRGGRSSKKKKSKSTRRKKENYPESDTEDSDWLEVHREETKRSDKVSRDPATVARRKERDTFSKRKGSFDGEEDDFGTSEEPRQCYWIHCLNAARPNSKYCSDECGILLAKHRILTFLPGRLEEFKKTPSVAEEKNKQELEKFLQERKSAYIWLEELERKRTTLDNFIEEVSNIDYQPNEEDNEDVQQEEDGTIACVSCGLDCSRKNYLKHIDRCYNKFERNMTFVSSTKTVVGGTPIHCDFLNEKTNRYCKRLKAICPEHTKPAKHRSNMICGAPIAKDLYELDTRKICGLAKKQCTRHNSWEKLRQVEIDMQRVEAWLKIETLTEQERISKEAMTNRGNVLGLLLHSTTNHELQNQEKYEIHRNARDEVVNDRLRKLAVFNAPVGNKIPKEEIVELKPQDQVDEASAYAFGLDGANGESIVKVEKGETGSHTIIN